VLTDIARAVAAVEEALVAAGRGAVPIATEPSPTRLAIAAGATSAIASRFLAVGTPRSIGLIGTGAVARASLAAHRVLFAPREIRIADGPAAQALADEVHGRVTTLSAGVYGTLGEIAAGLKDGRQLDEITLFLAGSLAAPLAAIAQLAGPG
jgi:ornithine cyclodeaminase/alanine dehydrogenase-like protein (mu-crystallin family)